ncbi:glycosyltransferase family 92 protein [Pimephales promelas]|nr:glycosyltransferase family 92 protein [Pimephales promelas]
MRIIPVICGLVLFIFILLIYLNKLLIPKLTQNLPKPKQIYPKPKQIYPKPTQIFSKPPQIHPKPTQIHPKPTPKACGVQVEDDPGIKVGSLHTYVIGSYMDHRFNVKQIKMIAIVLRDEKVTYRCVMCCEGRNVTSPAEYIIHYDHFGFEYGTATITCQIHSSCSTPTHVALTASEISDSITSFQPIRNRDVPTVFPYSFTVCISVMYDYENVLGLVQAMEMFRLLGAQRVVIYKTNCDSDIQKVLDYYVKSGLVEIIPWTIKKHINVSNGWRKSDSPGQLHYYGQIPALNDCVYRYMYQSRYLALHDMDEFILPLKVKSWTDLLRELENTYGTNVGFEFENNIFPCTANPDYGQKKWKKVRRLSPSTLKVYITAIAVHHAVEGESMGKHDLIIRSEETESSSPSSRSLLSDFNCPAECPFEPLQSVPIS